MIRDRQIIHARPRSVVAILILFTALPVAAQDTAAPAAGGSAQNPFLGSVPVGRATATPLQLSLKDAFDRALRYNLGAIEADQASRAARATRLRSLSALLPNLSGRISSTLEQINLKALGFNLHIPGFNIPTIVGPFGVADARASLSQQVFNWSDYKNLKAATESEKASQSIYQNDRDLVVQTAGNAYLLVVSDLATVTVTRAQLDTAKALFQQTSDRHQSGLVASIDELRARVEQQTQQQRLIAAENQLAIDKLMLARVIGLPGGQPFEVTDAVPYAPLESLTIEEALQKAYATRSDYRSAQEQVRAAELTGQAASAENYPTVSVNTDFGDIGNPNFASSHETFSFMTSLNIPIFQGTRVRADKLQANAELRQRQAEMEDLRGRIDEQVRTAFLNLKSASDLVEVAKSNIDLGNQTLTEAQDRLSAGVADNLEVVQAQESVASANQSYIASVYAYNLAKISLAQAMGVAEQSALRFLGAK